MDFNCGFSKQLCLQASLSLLVQERPRIPKMSRILGRRKAGKKGWCHVLTYPRAVQRIRESYVTYRGPSWWPFQTWHVPILGSWRLIPTGQLILGCCSGLCARQTLAFTQWKPECTERKTRQVLCVNGRKGLERTILCPSIWTLAWRVLGSTGVYPCSMGGYQSDHVWSGAFMSVKMEEACIFGQMWLQSVRMWMCLWHECLSTCCVLW
jgi:hypothetical protein